MSDLLEHIERLIRHRRLLRDGQPLLLAVSGGLDSMVLLRVMHGLSERHNWQLTVAHLNHQLRGRSSDADERLVRRTAANLRLPVVVQRADVREFERVHKLSLEMAARKLRHDFLARTALRKGISTIVLAHHADDQLELFFLRLLRGSSGEGLAGMKWRNPSPADPRVELVRPLLDVPKSVLRDYAIQWKIAYREDATNMCLDIQRNRLRHELLPLLRRKYQPVLHKTVLRASEIVGAEADFVTQAAIGWLRRKRGSGGRPSPFGKLHVAAQRRCIQLQLLELGINPDFELVENLRLRPERNVAVAAQSQATASGAQPAAGTARARRVSASLSVCDRVRSLFVSRDRAGLVRSHVLPKTEFQSGALEVDLTGDGQETLLDGVQIRWRTQPHRAGRRPSPKAGCEYFDAEKIGPRIRLRHWRPGDRFQPIGMPNSIKLQDFFTNAKIARARRHELIVGEATNGGLFWVEGLRISEQFKLARTTRRRLQWRWRRL